MPRGRSCKGRFRRSRTTPEMHVVLVGDQAQIEPLLACAQSVRDRLEIFHAAQVITMEESPAMAFRKKPDNSISRCWQLLQQRKVEAIVSAGNTGAMVAGGFLLRLFLKGVRRPGIAALMPTAKGMSVLLDVGANVHPKPAASLPIRRHGGHLRPANPPARQAENRPSQRRLRGRQGKHPRQGDAATSSAPVHLKDQFIGNIEGRDIHKGVCEVIVTDGFVGNVVLKVCEGVFEFVMKVVAKEVIGTLKTEIPLAQQAPWKYRQALRLPRAWRRPAPGRGRHLHHLPRQLQGTRHRQRPAMSPPSTRGPS